VNVSTLVQPAQQLGNEISELLAARDGFTRIALVSAFASLRTVLRLRDPLLQHAANGTRLSVTVGIDLGGTSREVLEELARWDVETFVFHNPNPRATFHPKAYLFETGNDASLYIGSNNLTEGGFFTNYELATHFAFDLPGDRAAYDAVIEPVSEFLFPQPGPTLRPLDAALIHTLVARGQLPSEADVRASTRRSAARRAPAGAPASPFAAVGVPLAPLLPANAQAADTASEPVATEQTGEATDVQAQPVTAAPYGILVWRKTLPSSDALRVRPGTKHVGGVRLTQARFENPPGQRIDQTTYFRQLFADYAWVPETGRYRGADQEHTFVPMRIVIRGMDYGVHNFEISHKPSGEAGQANYTTILRWGRTLTPIVRDADITGCVLSLYELDEPDVGFLIDIA